MAAATIAGTVEIKSSLFAYIETLVRPPFLSESLSLSLNRAFPVKIEYVLKGPSGGKHAQFTTALATRASKIKAGERNSVTLTVCDLAAAG